MTNAFRTGSPYGLGIAKETTDGTYHAPTIFPAYGTFEPDDGITDESIKAHTGSRGTDYRMIRSKVEPKASLTMGAWPEMGLEQLWDAILGHSVSAQNGTTEAYTHTFTEDPNLPTYSLNYFSAVANESPMAYTGCKLNSLKFDYKEGEITTTADWITNSVDLSQSKPTATYANTVPFTFRDFICKIGVYGSFTFVDADVTVATDIIAEPNHGLITGDTCTLSNTGGALPTGLTTATTYYIIYVDNDSFKLASSLANAHAGTAVDITAAAGGGTHTLTKTSVQNNTVTSASVEINNNIISKPVANNSYNPLKIPGALEVKGRVEFPMQNLDEYRRYIGGSGGATTVDDVITDRAIVLQLQGALIASGTPNYYYDQTIALPKVNLAPLKITHDDNDPVYYGFDFKAFKDTSSGNMISATVTSRLTSIT